MAGDLNTNERYYSNRAIKRESNTSPLLGIYVGKIVKIIDTDRTCRYDVTIPSLNKEGAKNETYPCFWTSPFAGSTRQDKIGTAIEDSDQTMKSYGFWAAPPDEGNMVLVAFGDGNSKMGYIISCLFPDKFNHMIPGIPAGKSYGDPSLLMPVAEKNKRDEKLTHNDAIRPLQLDLAEGIVKQGLINDPLRGAGSSGARRADINEVYGMLTPGPKDPNNSDTRLGGHQFVMDDNLDSRLIRLRTAGGSQLLMDDTTGVVYIINKKGTAWFEMNTNGDIYMHSEGTIAMRAKGNFDLRADKNVNIEAGQNINIKAAGDNAGDEYLGIPDALAVGVPPLGNGGSINIEATGDISQFAGLNAQLTAGGGDIDLSAGGRLAATAGGPLGIDIHAASGGIRLQSAQPSSVMASAFNVSAATTAITSGQILLNSGGAPALPAVPAVSATKIGIGKGKKDAAKNAPEFDRDAGRQGKQAATSLGERTGKADKIKTIVGKLVTAEPYSGHYSIDPIEESGKLPSPSSDLLDALPSAAIDFSGKPVNVNTPGGYLKGTGYTDQNGNPLTSVQEVRSDVGNIVSSGVDSVAGFVQSGADAIAGALPQFTAAGGVLNNLTALADIDLLEITGLGDLVNSLTAALPPIRLPTTNALGQKIIGYQKQLSEMESQLKQFAIDAANLPATLASGAVGDMQSAISSAVSAGGDVVDNLAKQGITTIQDGPGKIFQDASGNKIVDFSEGLGPAGSTLGLVSDFNNTFNTIKGAIDGTG